MHTRSILSCLILVTLTVALYGCEKTKPLVETKTLTSPPIPQTAPVSMVKLASSALKVESTLVENACVSNNAEKEGIPVAINLEDPGGSGAYKFDPSKELKFNNGELITFILTGETELHTFTIDQLGIDQCVDPGGNIKFTFKFNKPGLYPLICTPHKAEGMVADILIQ